MSTVQAGIVTLELSQWRRPIIFIAECRSRNGFSSCTVLSTRDGAIAWAKNELQVMGVIVDWSKWKQDYDMYPNYKNIDDPTLAPTFVATFGSWVIKVSQMEIGS